MLSVCNTISQPQLHLLAVMHVHKDRVDILDIQVIKDYFVHKYDSQCKVFVQFDQKCWHICHFWVSLLHKTTVVAHNIYCLVCLIYRSLMIELMITIQHEIHNTFLFINILIHQFYQHFFNSIMSKLCYSSQQVIFSGFLRYCLRKLFRPDTVSVFSFTCSCSVKTTAENISAFFHLVTDCSFHHFQAAWLQFV